MDEETNDVKQGEEQTPSDSSTAEETTTESAPETGFEDNTNVDTLADGTPVDQKTVPYSVFKETKEELKEIKEMIASRNQQVPQPQTNVDPQEQAQREQVKQAFKDIASELGYVSKDDLRREKADEQLEGSLKSLETKYSGKDDPELKFNRQEVIDYAIKNGISNPEMAFKLMKEEAFANYRIRQAVSKSQGFKTEGSDGSGSQSVQTTDEDLKEAIARGDKKAKDILLSRVAGNILRSKT